MLNQVSKAGRTFAALTLAVGAVACTVDKDAISGPVGGLNDPTFANASSALQTSCASCHGASSGRLYRTTMDSATLVASGLLDPGNPGASQLLVKPRSASHGGGIVAAFTTRDSALVAAWIRTLPNVSATTISAVKTDFAPTIDGVGEATWLQATPLTVPIAGGWAAAASVSVRAMYDAGYVYMMLRWTDNEASYRRNPWIKNLDGTWSVAAAKPAPTNGQTWQQYMAARGGVNFNPEAAEYMYEDKMALIWNTYGASTVPEFETIGCAAVCHDPANNGGPGTTYNGTQRNLAAKKYTNVAGQFLDMWHWKLVRQNMNGKMHDQYVRFWVPVNDATAGDGGRASDAGVVGYASNPATGGRPTFKSATRGILPPIYSWPTSDTLRMTDAEVLALPVGTMVANMMTTMPTLSGADVDGFGVYDAVLKQWTYEIRRRLTTADANDVQFTDLTRAYKFGLAVFDNAQIEHSYSGPVLSFRFKP